MNRRPFVLATLLIAASVPALGQSRLLPVDQAASVPDFFTFRAQLQVAIAKRDVQAVIAALKKDVQLSFGGDAGLEDFKKIWKPTAPDSVLWETMAAVLALGGTFGPDGAFTAPYVFTRWPSDKMSFTHMAALGTGIRVRGTPSAEGPVVAALDYSIVEVAGTPNETDRWIQVNLGSGRTGFVDRRYLRSPIDYRIAFVKAEGRWQIAYFLAGD